MPELIMHSNGSVFKIETSDNNRLLDILKEQRLAPDTPCNGKGTCGKCKVIIRNGYSAFSSQEKKLLTINERDRGIHLACETIFSGDMEIELLHKKVEAAILTDSPIEVTKICPLIQKTHKELPIPSLADQISDDERLFNTFEKNMNLPLAVLKKLPDILRASQFKVTAIYDKEGITGVEPGNTEDALYGIAVDIGTTTLAAYLYHLPSGKQLSVASMLNPQRQFGADVISRIDYASNSNEKQNEMKQILLDGLNNLFLELVNQNSLSVQDIYLTTLAGNTTMLHLFLGLPAKNMAVAPFIPLMTRMRHLTPDEAGLAMNPGGRVIILPSIASYVGADTVAAVLSTEMHRKSEISLMIDIGTNGEIVLGNKDFLLACSTAAGPAFEGANISCGVGGVRGAISRLTGDASEGFRIKTIGDALPFGICGSGIVDAIAFMVETGLLDETGRMAETDELPEEWSFLGKYLVESNRQPAFLLVPSELTGHGEDIIMTQKDIRELQNAKAAIAAGIGVLVKEAGLTLSDIKKVYLAGGFGNYMNIDSALTIGLLPKELQGRIIAVGNAAGAGAVQSLLSADKLDEADLIAKKVKYLELSSNPLFVQEYMEQMLFNRID